MAGKYDHGSFQHVIPTRHFYFSIITDNVFSANWLLVNVNLFTSSLILCVIFGIVLYATPCFQNDHQVLCPTASFNLVQHERYIELFVGDGIIILKINSSVSIIYVDIEKTPCTHCMLRNLRCIFSSFSIKMSYHHLLKSFYNSLSRRVCNIHLIFHEYSIILCQMETLEL